FLSHRNCGHRRRADRHALAFARPGALPSRLPCPPATGTPRLTIASPTRTSATQGRVLCRMEICAASNALEIEICRLFPGRGWYPRACFAARPRRPVALARVLQRLLPPDDDRLHGALRPEARLPVAAEMPGERLLRSEQRVSARRRRQPRSARRCKWWGKR